MEKHGQGMDPYPQSRPVPDPESKPCPTCVAAAALSELSEQLFPTSSAVQPGEETVAMTKETICEEANRLTQGERGNAYGPPEQDFARTADMVTSLFAHKLREGERFVASDVARIMICLKLSRSTWSSKRDNPVDIAGYAQCLHRCETGAW